MKTKLMFLLAVVVPTVAFADAKSLLGSWQIDENAAVKKADELEKSGKKDAALGLAIIASTKMKITFTDKAMLSEMANPFDKKGGVKKETASYVVASSSGDSVTLKVTDDKKKKAKDTTFIVKGDSLTLSDKGIEIPFVRVK